MMVMIMRIKTTGGHICSGDFDDDDDTDFRGIKTMGGQFPSVRNGGNVQD